MARLASKRKRPSWMTPYGFESFSDVFIDRLNPEWPGIHGDEWVPSMDFYQKEGAYVLTLDLPGLRMEDFDVTVDNNTITVSGMKESEKEESGELIAKEKAFGSFSRSIRLPRDVDENEIKGSFESGVLTLTLPKEKEFGKISIEIN